ncbi:MAG TPA: glycolate oxidase subunit GlcF, partial [Burkholderiales bacterium]|nr:glycolate oxidase subunit GlcF [Burkholderiales bacterium]
ISLRLALPRPRVFKPLLKMGQLFRPVLPGALKRKVPKAGPAPYWPAARHERKMLVLDGCVQPGLAPNINAAAARVFDALKISLVRAQGAGCCGALSYHLNAQAEGLDYMRQNIDAWSPHIEQGTQAVVMTASGCGVMVKEYGHLLAHDLSYAGRAERVSALTGDLSEILHAERDALKPALERAAKGRPATKLAFHSPCTLQHGQQIRGFAEELLRLAGFELTYVPDAHLCCGSAGTYSILQPELSQQLLRNKVTALQSGGPQLIATANIGCLTHLESGTQIPVKHWIEVLDERLASAAPA